MQQDHEKPKAAKAAPPTSAQAREARLKAALKANMGRRKAQARARANDDLANDDLVADDQPTDADDDNKNK